MRIFMAAIAGAVIVFVVSAILHMATPLGSLGLKFLPNEDAVLASLRTNVPQSGLYLFPGIDMRANPTEAQTRAWMEKVRSGPTGFLAYNAGGGEALSPRQLVLEFLTALIAALIAAILLARIGGSTISRALAVALLPAFAFFSVSASHWIWYGFPAAFVLGQLATELIAWTLAGLAMARIVRSA